jgi:hypothetical protein
LEGDADTRYFDSVANGRRRKCKIIFLEDGDNRITEQGELVVHINDFYRKLFGMEKRGTVRMSESMWQNSGRLSAWQKEDLIRLFTLQEVEFAIKDMKTETTPRPYGFLVIFYKKLWGILKWWIMQIMEDFHIGELNLSRINYGIIVLLPNIKEVANIRQYRPICLLNAFYKLFTKVLSIRLMGVVHDIISET